MDIYSYWKRTENKHATDYEDSSLATKKKLFAGDSFSGKIQFIVITVSNVFTLRNLDCTNVTNKKN